MRLVARAARMRFMFGLATIGAASAAVAATREPTAVTAAAGPWEIALQGTAKKCGLVLRAENANAIDHVVAIPSGCRHAMPALGLVRGWNAADANGLTLDGKAGEAELKFARDDDGKLVATGPTGEIYEIAPTGPQHFDAPKEIASQPAVAVAAKVAAPKPPEITTSAAMEKYPGKLSDLAGRYVILREGVEGGRDVGCMLTLDDKARGPGGFHARLAPACRDNGIVIFSPVGWNFERGRLILTAEKGHSASFEYHADGGWWKDSKEGGRPLGVRHF